MIFEQLIEFLNAEKNTNFIQVGARGQYLSEFYDESKKITICFSRHFPLQLPDFFIPESNEIRPHIDSTGKLCLFDATSVLINIDKPELLLVECYDRAIDIIELDRDKQYVEILREADSYWLHLAHGWNVVSTINFSSIVYRQFDISSYESKDKIQRFYLAETIEKTKELELKLDIRQGNNHYWHTCTVIRLNKGTRFIKLKEKYAWNELRQYILSNTSANAKRKFQKYTNEDRKAVVEVIILIMPSEFGDIAFGFLIFGHAKRFVPFRNILGLTCIPLYVRRMDYRYLVNRAGAISMLEHKSVLLLGCGSVGSFIAANLCKVGIKNIDILDNDVFFEENIYRHYLGVSALANKNLRNKADLMKENLENDYLEVDIDSLSFRDRSLEAFIEEPERFKNYDVIISALGEPTLNLKVNDILKTYQIKVPFVVAFNEPYGIGGHTIVTNMGDEGCLQCLYTDVLSDELCSLRVSLVEPNQSFKKNISGCGSAFVPYSALDSEQTAINTVRAVSKILLGKETDNFIFTWFGDDSELVNEGFRTSEYYTNHKDYGAKTIRIQKNCNCKKCQGININAGKE